MIGDAAVLVEEGYRVSGERLCLIPPVSTDDTQPPLRDRAAWDDDDCADGLVSRQGLPEYDDALHGGEESADVGDRRRDGGPGSADHSTIEDVGDPHIQCAEGYDATQGARGSLSRRTARMSSSVSEP